MDYAKDYAAELGIDEKYAEIYSPEAVDAILKLSKKLSTMFMVVVRLAKTGLNQ